MTQQIRTRNRWIAAAPNTKTRWLAVVVFALMPIVTGATPNFGVLFNIISRGTTEDAIVASGHVGKWNALVHTNRSSDFVVQDVALAPGGYSGWHTHPGPALVTIKRGTATLYQADDPECTPQVFSAGDAFTESMGHVHAVRNEGTEDLELLVTYITPVGAAQRIDAPHPDNCPSVP
jgi:quercetin dioxygenase-like cupin family protein